MKSGKKLLKTSIFILLAVIVSVIVWAVLTNTAKQIPHVYAASLEWKANLRLLRWGIIVCVFIFWNSLIDLLSSYKDLNEQQIKEAKAFRVRAVLYLIAMELLIVEALPLKLIGN